MDVNNSVNVSSHSSIILSLLLHCRLTSFHNYLTSSPALFLVTEMGDGHTVSGGEGRWDTSGLGGEGE